MAGAAVVCFLRLFPLPFLLSTSEDLRGLLLFFDWTGFESLASPTSFGDKDEIDRLLSVLG